MLQKKLLQTGPKHWVSYNKIQN